MWNQVNYIQNYYANIGTSVPYNQWSYMMVSCPHHRAWPNPWAEGTRERTQCVWPPSDPGGIGRGVSRSRVYLPRT
jgi:hypothetical protein